MRRYYCLLALLMVVCIGCQWHLRSADEERQADEVTIERLDMTESLFLTTGDFAALQQLKTSYPRETRMLIEDVLQLGLVNDSNINSRFLNFFQDSVLQTLLADVEHQYSDMNDVQRQLTASFRHLQTMFPEVTVPRIYTQVGALAQSIIVDDNVLGISLDKYLGEDYPLYLKFDYTEQQRQTMTRRFIVPDCLSFYLISLYPLRDFESATDDERHWHIAKIQHIVNMAMNQQVFSDSLISTVAQRLRGRKVHAIDEVMSMER